jgi:hypothetical protein
VPERTPVISAPASGPGSGTGSLPIRNRRTAWVLVAWIVLLMLASAAVAWLRN